MPQAGPRTTREIQVGSRRVIIQYPPELQEVTDQALAGVDYPNVLPAEHEVRVVVDIGANVGGSALLYASRHPEARIYCFEPAAEAFQLLAGNTAALPQIECIKIALSDENST